MKKILIIFLILFVYSSVTKASSTGFDNTENFSSTNNVNDFNQWLYDNGHKQYLIIKENKKRLFNANFNCYSSYNTCSCNTISII